jgi:predicted alpha/beta-hydrolase family hydrolase
MDILADLAVDGPAKAKITILLAHGAGAGKAHPFMQTIAEGLAANGMRVVRFDFPYMIKARETGGRRPPDRQPVLLDAWRTMIDAFGAEKVLIAGKSLGGRIASLVADEAGVRGLICLGYPFHAPGKPENPRIEHLQTLKTPCLICQGTRDPFGRQDEVEGYILSKSIALHWLEDGEHSFKPRKSSGRSEKENLEEAVEAIAEFAARITSQ